MIVRSGNELRRPVVCDPASEAGQTSVAAWLAVLMRLLRLPPDRTNAIRDELEEHLRERVRDLMLAGSTESEAQRIAVSELGETADFARRLEHANRSPKRRLAMQLSLLGLGAVVVTSGALMLAPTSTALRPSQFDGRRVEHTPPPELTEFTVSITDDTTVGGLIESIDAAVPQSILLNWEEFEGEGADREIPLGVVLNDVAVPDAMRILTETLEEYAVFEWRFGPRIIEFAPQSVFDLRERVLVSYSIGGTLLAIEEMYGVSYDNAQEQTVDLVLAMVEAEAWADNGGHVATLMIVGGKMFVQAPPRIHTKVEWILSELGRNPDMEASRGDGGAPDAQGAPGAAGSDGIGMPIDQDRVKLERQRDECLEQFREIVLSHAPGDPEYREIRERLQNISMKLGTRIRSGDHLQVRVFELYVPAQWETFVCRVDESGVVRIPEVGVVPAAGLTEMQLEDLVETLVGNELLQNPMIDVRFHVENQAVSLGSPGSN